jgi:ketosteroid isomerase-like protein
MKRRHVLLAGLGAGGAVHAQNDTATWVAQVTQAERAFARSMAERQFEAFVALLSEQAVFFGGQGAHRGKAAVAAAWKPFFDGPKAPFSWEPDQVEVLADGLLAHSSGPVRNPEGQVFSRFNSVWRQEAPGVWRVVFDKGQPLSAADRERYGVKPPP